MRILNVTLIASALSVAFAIVNQPSPQDKATNKLPPAAPLLSKALCGTGTYALFLGNQPLGQETFAIKCGDTGGFSASGNTKLDVPGAPQDFSVTLDVDASGLPLRFSLKGLGTGQTVDQSITINKDIATVVDKGTSRELPYKGAVLFHPNAIFTYQFLLARYDTEKGGVQKIPTFSLGDVTVERTARDVVQPLGVVAGPPASFDRYTVQLGPATIIVWTDVRGRLSVMHVPSQNLLAVRGDFEAFAQPLRQALLASVKGLVPDYSAPAEAPFTAEEVTIKTKGLSLAGTLLLPKHAKGRLPVVVTSTGSGQQTRDEPLPIPGLEGYGLFRQIARALASSGIAVLRCDDRGVGDSTGLDTLANTTTLDFADDVRAQIAYLRGRSDIDPDRIAIVGHSEGGAIAPLVAGSDRRLAAIVLLAGPGKSGYDILRFQLNYPHDTNPKLSAEEKARKHEETDEFLRTVMAAGDTSKYPPLMRLLNAPWTRWFLSYDPLPAIRKVRQPILILQGGLDQQVTAEQASLLAEAAKEAGNKDVTSRVFTNLNHLFLPAKTGAESEYSSLQTSQVGDDVLETIAEWLSVKLGVKPVSGARR